MSKFTDFCGGKVAVDELVTALHETAATECVCRTWFCKAFDVVTKGASASYVYICFCRKELDKFK